MLVSDPYVEVIISVINKTLIRKAAYSPYSTIIAAR